MATNADVARSCKIKDCKRPYRAKGYCNVHFRKWRQGELEAKPRYKICGEENCRKPMYRKGYCEQHYSAWSASKKAAPAKVAPSLSTPPPESAPAEKEEVNS